MSVTLVTERYAQNLTNSGPDSHGSRVMQHFHVRLSRSWGEAGTVHRVYVTEGELIFLDTELKALDGDVAAQFNPVVANGGLIGAMAQVICADNSQAKAEQWRRALDNVSEDRLMKFIENDPKSFRIAGRDCYDVRVDPPGIWDLLTRPRDCKALARIGHPEHRKLTLEILSIQDATVVIMEFPKIFGPACQINIRWDSI